jgi:hypothetical protein
MIVAIPTYHDNNNHIELRYALRSMVKHFKSFTDVLLIGTKPEWYTGKVLEVEQVETKHKRKEYQVILKMLNVGGYCLYSNDDFFALEDFDLTLPQYYDGTCRKAAIKYHDQYYKNMHQACPEGWLNFEVHCPMVMNTTILERELPEDWHTVDRPMKSIYANKYAINPQPLPDCKLRGNMSYENAKAIIKSKPFFSTCDNANYPGIANLLQELYPLSSIYETP